MMTPPLELPLTLERSAGITSRKDKTTLVAWRIWEAPPIEFGRQVRLPLKAIFLSVAQTWTCIIERERERKKKDVFVSCYMTAILKI